MIIATRVLTFQADGGDVEVPVRLFVPEQEAEHWICRFEIGWPDGELKRYGAGIDAVQALVIALRMIGALLYTSVSHESGRLRWHEPQQGYGFPVAKSIRDLLVGYDREFDGP